MVKRIGGLDSDAVAALAKLHRAPKTGMRVPGRGFKQKPLACGAISSSPFPRSRRPTAWPLRWGALWRWSAQRRLRCS